MRDWFATPILIPVRDRLTDLVKLLDWLDKGAYWNITLIDNASTWPPLVGWLGWTREYRIKRLAENVGSRSPWLPQFDAFREDYYVVTDPDVVPIEACPADLVGHLAHLLGTHPEVPKAGPGIYIQDAPQFRDRYREQLFHNAAERWVGDCFRSPIETTFALYRPGVPFSFEAVRAAHPFEVRHLPFYRETDPTEEDRYYLAHAKPSGLTETGTATGGSDWAAWAH